MLTEYIDPAVQHAQYERVEGGTFFGEIPNLEGLRTNARTEEEAVRSCATCWKAGFCCTSPTTTRCQP
ncbi:MAG TPA: hypothetical protein VFU88_11175 [Ktedonobacterales bacterium]|nr:hypothetical protein [Ktedonobacterales bacterium]